MLFSIIWCIHLKWAYLFIFCLLLYFYCTCPKLLIVLIVLDLMIVLLDELYNYIDIGNVKDFLCILWNGDLMLFSITWCILSKWVYPCIFCWTVMIVLFDTRIDYAVTSKEHVTQGWGGRGGGLRGKIRPSVIYLCFVLVGTNLRFRYDFGSMLYLFP